MALILANEVALVASMPSDAVLFDVGANVGDWTEMARQVLDHPCVYAFEPSPAWTRFAKRHPDVTLEPIALGATPGAQPFFTPDPRGSELGSFFPRKATGPLTWSHIGDVRVDTLDNACERHGVDRIDLLKLDVEGAEYDVLRGAERTLAEGVIRHIFWEQLGDSPRGFGHFWRGLTGYRFWELAEAGVRSIACYDESLEPVGDTQGPVRFFGATRDDLALPAVDAAAVARQAPINIHTPV